MKTSPCHRKIIAALRKRLMSRRDIEEFTGLRSGTVCARVSELFLGGVIEPRGVKRCPYTGRRVEVLRLRKQPRAA